MPTLPGKRKRCYIGIDPGVQGGIAAIMGDLRSVEAQPMPETEQEILDALRHYTARFDCVACIEWIHPAIQGIGKSQMSKLYGNYMSLRMALSALQISYEIIQPKKWQGELGIQARKNNETRNKWKARLRQKAQQIFPRIEVTLATADALMIAECCRRLNR